MRAASNGTIKRNGLTGSSTASGESVETLGALLFGALVMFFLVSFLAIDLARGTDIQQ